MTYSAIPPAQIIWTPPLQRPRVMSYSFEIILSGTFPADDPNTLKAIQNRLSLHTNACQILHRHDLEFHLAPTVQYNMGSLALPQMPAMDVSSLYLKHDLVKQRDGARGAWCVYAYLCGSRTDWYQKGAPHASETYQGSCESAGTAGHQSGYLNRGSVGVCLCDGIHVRTVLMVSLRGY